MYCCVPYCNTSTRNKKIGDSFHELPSNMELRKLWLAAISRENWSASDHGKYQTVCSKHFQPSDYVEGLKIKKLKKTAVPSQFPDYPQHKQPTKKKSRPDTSILKRQKFQEIKSNSLEVAHDEFKNVTQDSPSQVDMIKESSQFPDNPLHKQPAKKKIKLDTSILKRQKFQEVKPNSLEVAHDKFKYPTKDFSSQVDIIDQRLKRQEIKMNRMQRKIQDLQGQNDELRRQLYSANKESTKKQINLIFEDTKNGEVLATMIHDQIHNYKSKKMQWSKTIIRFCTLWQANSPKGYNFCRNSGLINLPTRKTLKQYCAPNSKNNLQHDDVTPLMTLRIENEVQQFEQPQEKLCSYNIFP